jgi:hypothetical protein
MSSEGGLPCRVVFASLTTSPTKVGAAFVPEREAERESDTVVERERERESERERERERERAIQWKTERMEEEDLKLQRK